MNLYITHLLPSSSLTQLRCVFDSFSQYLGSMIIRDLRGIESTQDACAKIRVNITGNKNLLKPFSSR